MLMKTLRCERIPSRPCIARFHYYNCVACFGTDLKESVYKSLHIWRDRTHGGVKPIL